MHRSFVENVIYDMGINFQSPTNSQKNSINKSYKEVDKLLYDLDLKIKY